MGSATQGGAGSFKIVVCRIRAGFKLGVTIGPTLVLGLEGGGDGLQGGAGLFGLRMVPALQPGARVGFDDVWGIDADMQAEDDYAVAGATAVHDAPQGATAVIVVRLRVGAGGRRRGASGIGVEGVQAGVPWAQGGVGIGGGVRAGGVGGLGVGGGRVSGRRGRVLLLQDENLLDSGVVEGGTLVLVVSSWRLRLQCGHIYWGAGR